MTMRQSVAVGERDAATATQCERELRVDRDRVRRANEVLRRALRGVEEAEGAFHQATLRLDRRSRVERPDGSVRQIRSLWRASGGG